jgi:hypothetical protein
MTKPTRKITPKRIGVAIVLAVATLAGFLWPQLRPVIATVTPVAVEVVESLPEPAPVEPAGVDGAPSP